jgi:hypothetical protein
MDKNVNLMELAHLLSIVSPNPSVATLASCP